MCQLSMYLVVTYQSTYIYIGPISYGRGYQRWTQIFNSVGAHHNWVIMWGIQWMLVVAGSLWPLALPLYKKKPQAPLKWQREGVMSYLFGNTEHEWGPPSLNDEKHDLSIYEGR
jgi:hypothetical protein